MVPKHQSGDANSSVSFELATSNYFLSRRGIGSSHILYYYSLYLVSIELTLTYFL